MTTPKNSPDTIDLLYGNEFDEQTLSIAKNLQSLGSEHSSLLARLLVTLNECHPKAISGIEQEAFISTAIKITNQYGISAFPVLQDSWLKF